jgi:hypothetical protein
MLQGPTRRSLYLMTNKRTLLPLLLVVAAIIRMIGFSGQSLTMDECLEIKTARMTAEEIILAPNSFPPLYHLLLKSWLTLDQGRLAVRTFSFVVGMLSIVAIWKLGTEAVDEKLGLIAAALASVSPFHVYYSQEGRGYILFILLGTLAMLYGLRLLREPSTRDRVAFVIVCTLGCYTHYYFALLLVSIGVGILGAGGIAYFAKNVIPLAIVIGLLCSPLLVLLGGDLDFQRDLRQPRPANVAAIGYTLFSFESGYTLGPSRNELHTLGARDAFFAALPWLLAVGAVVGCLVLKGAIELWQRREFVYWITLLALPFVLVMTAGALLGITYNTRFLVCSWIPYCILVSCGLMAFSSKARVVAVVALTCIYGIAIVNRHFIPRYENEDVHAVAQFLKSAESRPVFVCAGYLDQPLLKYVEESAQIVRLVDRGFSEGSDERALSTVLSHESPFWLLYSRPFHGDPDGVILQTLQRERAMKSVFEAAGVRLFDGRRRATR